MEVEEQIKVFREFIEQNYYPQLLEGVRKGQMFLALDFSELVKFNTELSEELLENPEEVLKAGEMTVKEFDLPLKVQKFTIRLTNLPESQKINVSDIRSKHLNKFLWTEGVVRQKSDVRPHVAAAKFECPSCGNVITILQLDKKYKEPSKCSCGRKGKFKEISRELVDGQGIVLEENADEMDGVQPKRINVFLKDDLVAPISERRTGPGSRVRICGWVTEVPIILKTGGQSTKYDLIIEANNIESLQEDSIETNISEPEEEEIKKIARNPNALSILAGSIAPSIYGHDKIKEALVLQLAGGCRKMRSDEVSTRGDIHMLLVGDPGSGKSQILKRITKIAPKARFTSGKGSTAAGLCVAPDSLVLTNPSGINKIQELVEEQLKDNQTRYAEGIYKNVSQANNERVWSFDNNLKLQSKSVESFWKIKSPENLYTITLRSGKKISLTENTRLFQLNKSQPEWKKSSELKKGDYVATARKLPSGSEMKFSLPVLIEQNPVVHKVKAKVRTLLNRLTPKYTKRELAKILGTHENNLYSFWVREDLVGNIRLKEYLKLLDLAKEEIDENLTLSLYNGKKFNLPKAITGDFMYFLGLVAGDGDLPNHNNNFGIRLSNASSQLIDKFVELVKMLFNQTCNITVGNKQRPTSARFNNKVVFKIINQFGIPPSPKSDKIDLSNLLLSLPNEKIAAFLSGLYDTDGSVNYRKQKNCHIELTTTSKSLAEKVQLVLLRFEIMSYLRSRQPRPGRIKSKLKQYRLRIYGADNLEKFEQNIGFYKNEKKEKLHKCINEIQHRNTNVDIIPETNTLLKNLLQEKKVNTKKLFGYKTSSYTSSTLPKNVSRNYLKALVGRFNGENGEALSKLKMLADSDLFWDEIVSIEKEKSPYEYVYDLTIQESHSFLVNGILVHNTASVVKDEFLGGWSLEAGTLVLANRGFAIIDEMDKMNKDDRSALHEALEQQQISISKANIQATLRCETTVLAAANPKLGRFDPEDLIARQIDLPPTLINRFDLIFAIKDLPNKEKDEQTATFILNLHKDSEIKAEVPTILLKKYFAYIRQKINPKITDVAIEELKDYYINMRNTGTKEESGIRTIPITPRQLEALVRLSEAAAKIRLAKTVTKKDAQKAIEMIDYCLNEIAKDKETGTIDIDRLGSRMTASQRGSISVIKEIMTVLEEQIKSKIIPVEDIINAAKEKNINEDQVNEILEKLRRSGDIFEPRKNFVQKL